MIRLPLHHGTSPGWDEVLGSVPNTLCSWGALRGTQLCVVKTRSSWALGSPRRTELEALTVTRALLVLAPCALTHTPLTYPVSSSARRPACILACRGLPGALVALRTRRPDFGRSRGNHVAAVSLLLLLHQAGGDTGQVFSTGTFRAVFTFHVAARVGS